MRIYWATSLCIILVQFGSRKKHRNFEWYIIIIVKLFGIVWIRMIVPGRLYACVSSYTTGCWCLAGSSTIPDSKQAFYLTEDNIWAQEFCWSAHYFCIKQVPCWTVFNHINGAWEVEMFNTKTCIYLYRSIASVLDND